MISTIRSFSIIEFALFLLQARGIKRRKWRNDRESDFEFIIRNEGMRRTATFYDIKLHQSCCWCCFTAKQCAFTRLLRHRVFFFFLLFSFYLGEPFTSTLRGKTAIKNKRTSAAFNDHVRTRLWNCAPHFKRHSKASQLRVKFNYYARLGGISIRVDSIVRNLYC